MSPLSPLSPLSPSMPQEHTNEPLCSVLPCTLRELPPTGARLCLEVRRFLAAQTEYTFRSRPVVNPRIATISREMVVGFSGGADSTALALVLRCLGIPICLVHLDHGLRLESVEEARAAATFAERLDVPCVIRRVDVAELARSEGTGLEEAGRQARYAFLEEVRQTRNADWIATGHHLDDLSEDVLLRLTRGTGWPGLGGMEAVDKERHLVRPLLTLQRKRLVVFLHELGVDWVEDASNQSDLFRRNRLRKHVIPLLQAENPAFAQAVRTLWELAREDDAYWDELLAPVFAVVNFLEGGEEKRTGEGEKEKRIGEGNLSEERFPLPVPHPSQDFHKGVGGVPCPSLIQDRANRTDSQNAVSADIQNAVLFLPREAFIRLPRAARLRVYMGMIRRFGGGQAQSETLFRLDQACTTSRSCKLFQLPGGISIQSDHNGLTVKRTPPPAFSK